MMTALLVDNEQRSRSVSLHAEPLRQMILIFPVFGYCDGVAFSLLILIGLDQLADDDKRRLIKPEDHHMVFFDHGLDAP